MGIDYSIVLLLMGIIIGIVVRKIIEKRHKVIGVVQVDHETGLCKFCITSEDLANIKCKKVLLNVDHNAIITEQELEDSQ